MSRIVQINQPGDASVLKTEEVADRPLKPNEIRINMKTIGINHIDIMYRSGYIVNPMPSPSPVGMEGAGTIEELGSEVTDFKTGDRVNIVPIFSMTDYGTYGERVIMPAHVVSRYPSKLSFEEAAALWMSYLMAYTMVEFAGINKGDFVLITAAAGSVGLAAIDICNYLGAISIATTRKAAEADLLRSRSATEVIITEKQDLAAEVKRMTNDKGVQIVFDPIAGSMLATAVEVAAQSATIFLYSTLSKEDAIYPQQLALSKNIVVRSLNITHFANPEIFARAKKFIIEMFEKSGVRPLIAETLPFSNIADAQRHLEAGGHIGKIVVKTN